MEIIKNIAAVVGCILAVVSLITLCTKGGRAFIASIVKRNTKDLHHSDEQQTHDISEIKTSIAKLVDAVNILSDKMQAVEEVSKQQCRDTIKDIYYRYHLTKKIPLYERKTADITYQIYRYKFEGNSYAELLYHEIEKWEIDDYNDSNIAE